MVGSSRRASGQVLEHLFRKKSSVPRAWQHSLHRAESWKAELPTGKLRLEGLVPDREQEMAACPTPGERITESLWLCPLTWWIAKSDQYTVASPATVEAQEASTCRREISFNRSALPPPHDSPSTRAQAGCPYLPQMPRTS